MTSRIKAVIYVHHIMRPTIVFLSIPSQVASILRNPFEIYYHVTVSWMIFYRTFNTGRPVYCDCQI